MSENPYEGLSFHENILTTVGKTPLVRLHSSIPPTQALVLAKVESFNPGRSVKDRIGIHILEKAERSGALKPGGTVIESTSGNTGLGLAIAAAVKGYKCICTMPDKMSREKINLLKAVGARVIVCPTAVEPDDPESYYSVCARLVAETPNSFHANQYHNQDNPEAHYQSTGPEIWEATQGRITHFVSSLGTGGTISGTGRYLKEMNPDVQVIGADPQGSILAEYFRTGKMSQAHPYLVEGVGEDIIPTATHFQYFDEILTVTDRESFRYARHLSRREGILSGGSCGTALAAAVQVMPRLQEGDVLVVMLPDTGERYLSKVHSDEWLSDNGMLEPDDVAISDVLRMKTGDLPDLITVPKGESLQTALGLIRAHHVSQIPVTDGDSSIVGTVLETSLMKAVLDDGADLEASVETLMDDPLLRLAGDQMISEAIRSMSRHRGSFLVEENGCVTGILSRFDLIGFAAR